MVLSQPPAQPAGHGPEPGAGSQGPQGCTAPSTGTPSGWTESCGCRESPTDGQGLSVCPRPHCFLSQFHVCPKGRCVARDGGGRQNPPEGIGDRVLTSLKTPMHLRVPHCASASLCLPKSREQPTAGPQVRVHPVSPDRDKRAGKGYSPISEAREKQSSPWHIAPE